MSETLKETKLLAEQGDVGTQYRLGYMYLFGDGVPENKAEALKWYRLAAEQGDAGAQARLRLALMSENTGGTER